MPTIGWSRVMAPVEPLVLDHGAHHPVGGDRVEDPVLAAHGVDQLAQVRHLELSDQGHSGPQGSQSCS